MIETTYFVTYRVHVCARVCMCVEIKLMFLQYIVHYFVRYCVVAKSNNNNNNDISGNILLTTTIFTTCLRVRHYVRYMECHIYNLYKSPVLYKTLTVPVHRVSLFFASGVSSSDSPGSR